MWKHGAFISKYNQRPLSLTSEAGNRKAPRSLAAGRRGTALYPHTSHHPPWLKKAKQASPGEAGKEDCPGSLEGCSGAWCPHPPDGPSSLGDPGVHGVRWKPVLNPGRAALEGTLGDSSRAARYTSNGAVSPTLPVFP